MCWNQYQGTGQPVGTWLWLVNWISARWTNRRLLPPAQVFPPPCQEPLIYSACCRWNRAPRVEINVQRTVGTQTFKITTTTERRRAIFTNIGGFIAGTDVSFLYQSSYRQAGVSLLYRQVLPILMAYDMIYQLPVCSPSSSLLKIPIYSQSSSKDLSSQHRLIPKTAPGLGKAATYVGCCLLL